MKIKIIFLSIITITLLILFINPLRGKYCYYCDNKINDELQVCPFCNKNLNLTNKTIKCPACETLNSSSALFCTHCGFPLKYYETYFQKGLKYFFTQNYDLALKYFNKVIENSPFFYIVYKFQIESLYKEGKLKNYTIPYKNPLLENYTKGIILSLKSLKKNSQYYFNKCLQINKNFAEAYLELYFLTQNLDYLKKSIKLKPSLYLSYLYLIKYSIENKQLDNVDTYIKKAITLCNFDYRLWYYAGLFNFLNNDFSYDTLSYFKKSMLLNKSFIKNYYFIGRIYYIKNNFLSAYTYLKKAIKSKDYEIKTLSNLYTGIILDRIYNFDLFQLKNQLKIENNDYMYYYINSIEYYKHIKNFKFINNNEINLIKNLEYYYNKLKNNLITSIDFKVDRRKLLFNQDE